MGSDSSKVDLSKMPHYYVKDPVISLDYRRILDFSLRNVLRGTSLNSLGHQKEEPFQIFSECFVRNSDIICNASNNSAWMEHVEKRELFLVKLLKMILLVPEYTLAAGQSGIWKKKAKRSLVTFVKEYRGIPLECFGPVGEALFISVDECDLMFNGYVKTIWIATYSIFLDQMVSLVLKDRKKQKKQKNRRLKKRLFANGTDINYDLEYASPFVNSGNREKSPRRKHGAWNEKKKNLKKKYSRVRKKNLLKRKSEYDEEKTSTVQPFPDDQNDDESKYSTPPVPDIQSHTYGSRGRSRNRSPSPSRSRSSTSVTPLTEIRIHLEDLNAFSNKNLENAKYRGTLEEKEGTVRRGSLDSKLVSEMFRLGLGIGLGIGVRVAQDISDSESAVDSDDQSDYESNSRYKQDDSIRVNFVNPDLQYSTPSDLNSPEKRISVNKQLARAQTMPDARIVQKSRTQASTAPTTPVDDPNLKLNVNCSAQILKKPIRSPTRAHRLLRSRSQTSNPRSDTVTDSRLSKRRNNKKHRIDLTASFQSPSGSFLPAHLAHKAKKNHFRSHSASREQNGSASRRDSTEEKYWSDPDNSVLTGREQSRGVVREIGEKLPVQNMDVDVGASNFRSTKDGNGGSGNIEISRRQKKRHSLKVFPTEEKQTSLNRRHSTPVLF